MFRSFVIGFALCCLSSLAALAGDCPVTGREEKLGLVANAPTCQEAARLFNLCTIGASFDAELALRVDEVCEKTSLAKLPENERQAYEAAIDACNAPYVKKRGTINRSVAAHCRVDAMADFAKRHGGS